MTTVATEPFLNRFRRALSYAEKIHNQKPNSVWLSSADLYDAMASVDYFAIHSMDKAASAPEGAVAKIYGCWIYGDLTRAYDCSQVGVLGGWKEAID